MFRTLKTAALSAMIAVAGVAAIPAASQAEGLYLNFGNGHDRGGAYFGDGAHQVRDYGDYRGRNRDRGCNANRALNKAERMGINRARVVDVSRRTITVRGRQYGERVSVTFARAPHCPVIG